MNARGQYGWRRTAVAGPFFHTVGDRDKLTDETDTSFIQLISELYRKMGGDPEVLKPDSFRRDSKNAPSRYRASEAIIKKSPLFPLWNDTVMPMWSEWKEFYNKQSSWEEFKTDWDTYENWSKRIQNLHGHVSAEVQRILGQTIRTPKPADSPKTVWHEAGTAVEKTASAVSEGAGDTWKFLKYGAWAALGLGAVVAVTSIASSVRSRKDPASSYLDVIRASRGRALPAGGA